MGHSIKVDRSILCGILCPKIPTRGACNCWAAVPYWGWRNPALRIAIERNYVMARKSKDNITPTSPVVSQALDSDAGADSGDSKRKTVSRREYIDGNGPVDTIELATGGRYVLLDSDNGDKVFDQQFGPAASFATM